MKEIIYRYNFYVCVYGHILVVYLVLCLNYLGLGFGRDAKIIQGIIAYADFIMVYLRMCCCHQTICEGYTSILRNNNSRDVSKSF